MNVLETLKLIGRIAYIREHRNDIDDMAIKVLGGKKHRTKNAKMTKKYQEYLNDEEWKSYKELIDFEHWKQWKKQQDEHKQDKTD